MVSCRDAVTLACLAACTSLAMQDAESAASLAEKLAVKAHSSDASVRASALKLCARLALVTGPLQDAMRSEAVVQVGACAEHVLKHEQRCTSWWAHVVHDQLHKQRES